MISLDLIAAAASRVRLAGTFVARRLRFACSRPAVWFTAPLLALQLLLLLPVIGLVYHIYFDRRGLPDLEPFIRFELPTIGHVYDAQGTVLVELAREYRRIVSYDEVPPVLRHAILAAEDKNFFSHSGVEYRALPRVVYKTAAHSVAAWGKGGIDFPAAFPSGGLDAHPAARPRLLPPGPFGPRERYRPVPPYRDFVGPFHGHGGPDHEQAPPEDGGDTTGCRPS